MIRLRFVALLFALLFSVVMSCDRTQSDQGLDAELRVTGAQFFRETMPADGSGPKVQSVTVGTQFSAGATGKSCSGETDRETTAVAIAIAGDVGYWVLRAGMPSASAIDAPTFTAELSFSSAIRPGPHELVVRAVDARRRFGPEMVKSITVTERGVPDGQLVISLSWDNGANLDLHVVDPSGVEIFKRNINSYEPAAPGSPREAPGTTHDGGVLDFDSHAECVPDGLSTENVVWRDAPPKGHYLVRVDTFSLCGEPIARWRVQAFLRGVRIGAAEGVGTEIDTRYAHDRGAGLLALEVDVP
jgi:hypothetical protein